MCCGFGGLFSVKYPEISERMADDKLADAEKAGAELLVGGDLGCLLHLAGRAERQGKTLRGVWSHAPESWGSELGKFEIDLPAKIKVGVAAALNQDAGCTVAFTELRLFTAPKAKAEGGAAK